MDPFYDVVHAGERLDAIATQRVQEDSDNNYAYLTKIKPAEYRVDEFTQPRAWRVCTINPTNDALEEGNFRIQGILVAKDLPPVGLAGNRTSKMRALSYCRQHVKITAFGSDFMNDGVLKMEELYVKMSRLFPDGVLEPWAPAAYEDFVAIEANARYFTPSRHSCSANIVDFAPYVDLNGNLKAMMGADWVHTSDNRVDYFKAVPGVNGSTLYEEMDPVGIKIGDIVEATVALAAIPTKSKTVKLQVLLRTLVLFDHSERDRAAILRMRERYNKGGSNGGASPAITKQPVLKRKCPYSKYNTQEDAEERFQRMRLD